MNNKKSKPLNYTTQIDIYKTVSEIQKILSENGAMAILIENNENGDPSSLSFQYKINNDYFTFKLKSNHHGIFRQLKNNKKISNKLKTEEQAMRVAWRINKDWVESQISYINAEMAELPSLFLQSAVTGNGLTVYEHIKNNTKLLQG